VVPLAMSHAHDHACTRQDAEGYPLSSGIFHAEWYLKAVSPFVAGQAVLSVGEKVIGVLLLLRRSHWRCTKQNKRTKPIFL